MYYSGRSNVSILHDTSALKQRLRQRRDQVPFGCLGNGCKRPARGTPCESPFQRLSSYLEPLGLGVRAGPRAGYAGTGTGDSRRVTSASIPSSNRVHPVVSIHAAIANRLSARPDVRRAPAVRVSQIFTEIGLFAASNAARLRLARSFDGSRRIALSNDARTMSAGKPKLSLCDSHPFGNLTHHGRRAIHAERLLAEFSARPRSGRSPDCDGQERRRAKPEGSQSRIAISRSVIARGLVP